LHWKCWKKREGKFMPEMPNEWAKQEEECGGEEAAVSLLMASFMRLSRRLPTTTNWRMRRRLFLAPFPSRLPVPFLVAIRLLLFCAFRHCRWLN
jgi:hypothetical protein